MSGIPMDVRTRIVRTVRDLNPENNGKIDMYDLNPDEILVQYKNGSDIKNYRFDKEGNPIQR